MDLKVWMIDVNETDHETGVEYVALVDDPAIIRTWQAFSKSKTPFKFYDQGEKRLVQGPLMIPNMPIYRNDSVHGEHYVMYTKDAIEKIVRKFFRQKNTGNVNLMHQPSATLNDVYMIESFVTDSSRGIHPPDGFENFPEGTWFGTYRVENDAVWNEVKAGTFKGFSVEGFFTYSNEQNVQAEKINNLIDAIINGTPEGEPYLQGENQNFMSLISSEKLAALKNILFGEDKPAEQAPTNEALTTDGKQVMADGGWVQGSKVFMMTEQGKIPAPDSTYELDNGLKCEVMNGVIMNVTEKQAQRKTKEELEAMAGKFASGTPDERIAGLETMVKALMECIFGYDIEQAKVVNSVEDAVTAYKNAFEKLEKQAEEIKAVTDSLTAFTEKFTAIEKQNGELKGEVSKVTEANKQIFSIMEKLESEPATESVTKDNEQPERKKAAWEIRAEGMEMINKN